MNSFFKVTTRYDFLAPPRDLSQEDFSGVKKIRREGWTLSRNGDVDSEKQKPDLEDDEEDEDERLPLPETEVLWHMSQSKKHRELLKHPVITSFLWMKWNRISSAYNKNVAFYSAFVLCLTLYIFLLYGGKSLRSDSLVVENCQNGQASTAVNVLWYFNLVLLVILALRECLQFGIAPRRYFFSFENVLEVALIVLVGILLMFGDFGCNVREKRHVAAVVIVLSWSELITMIGRHPKFSTYNIYVTMFYKVLSTFILFLAW